MTDFNNKTLEQVVEYINESPAQGFEGNTPEFLAAAYAVEAQEESGYEMSKEAVDAHFDVLVEHGAEFDTDKAQRIALFEQSEFGVVVFDDVKYSLVQSAYISDSGQHYQASAINAGGEEFTVLWNITSDDPENETDESNMCDWDVPVEVIAL